MQPRMSLTQESSELNLMHYSIQFKTESKNNTIVVLSGLVCIRTSIHY
ncbi:unnamed protein product (macronuclear) [Paramecium tetraurelia]|uniref:Uncharacterized protein n=1 Tax=Paramecium tetraurelia TaxID=5888 RepID=A0DVG3_PARTE|nr:uncharacterized protein GSPATT00039794001 [Paramecium tetraurelia]CAK87030.1 unnamed protein product [Paramecium tetraurelia]|eukprot:XP_001454427.1 hypothetical protein (macronuclear) [Paramecium tetraurelia strain d4-2]